jgi:hypothetical protein
LSIFKVDVVAIEAATQEYAKVKQGKQDCEMLMLKIYDDQASLLKIRN